MFITGRTQEELFQSIETAVSNGSLDITIYGIHPSFVNEDFGDFIVEQPITTLTFSDLEVISEYAVFCVDVKQISFPTLTSLNFPDLSAIIENRIFERISMPNLIFLGFPRLSAITGKEVFSGLSVPNLSGISFNRKLIFNDSIFGNSCIGHLPVKGPTDMTALQDRTHENLIYVNDTYGYASPPLIFSDMQDSVNIFDAYLFKNHTGATVTGLKITAVNEMAPSVTIGGFSIHKNGTITVNSPDTQTFTLRFSTSNLIQDDLIGACTVTVSSSTTPSSKGFFSSITDKLNDI